MLSYAANAGLALASASRLATLKLTVEVALLAPTPWLVADNVTAIGDVSSFECANDPDGQGADTDPYGEIVRYLKVHRDHVDQAFRTLAYFDGANLGARATAPALFSVGLMDKICPPSTVFAAYNHYAGMKQIKIWPYNYHEGGETFQTLEKINFLAQLWK